MRFKLGDKVTNYFRIDIKKNKEFLFLYKRTRILWKQSVAFSPWVRSVVLNIYSVVSFIRVLRGVGGGFGIRICG